MSAVDVVSLAAVAEQIGPEPPPYKTMQLTLISKAALLLAEPTVCRRANLNLIGSLMGLE